MSEKRTSDETILDSYRTVARAMDRLILPILVERDITMAQFKALFAVSNAGADGIAVTALGCELSIGQPSASLIVDQLEKKGYAERHPDDADRRRVLVRATPYGEELVTELRAGRRSTLQSWLDELDSEDAQALARGYAALAEVVRASSGKG